MAFPPHILTDLADELEKAHPESFKALDIAMRMRIYAMKEMIDIMSPPSPSGAPSYAH